MDIIALSLTIIGALNWGLIGLFGFDLVGFIFGGQGALISRIIFDISFLLQFLINYHLILIMHHKHFFLYF